MNLCLENLAESMAISAKGYNALHKGPICDGANVEGDEGGFDVPSLCKGIWCLGLDQLFKRSRVGQQGRGKGKEIPGSGWQAQSVFLRWGQA